MLPLDNNKQVDISVGFVLFSYFREEAGAEPREEGIPAILGTAAGGWAQRCGAPECVRNHWNQNLGWEHEQQDHEGAEEMPLNQTLKH